MGRQFLHVTSEGVNDELDMFGGYSLESFLDHVVPVLILDAFEHVVLKFPDQLRLLVGQDVFQGLRGLVKIHNRELVQDLPFARHGNRTFGRTVPQRDFSFGWLSLFSVIDCHAQRTSV